MTGVFLFTRTHRAPRAVEWSPARTVTFIVTLAAGGSVTLAARAAGMSRKSAYALKARDPAFAAAWGAALRANAGTSAKAPALSRSKGDKVEEVDDPRNSIGRGDTSRSRTLRSAAFADLLAALRDSPSLAPDASAQ